MHGDDWLVIILGLILLAMIVSPILAIVAFRAVRRLEAQLAAKQRGPTFTPGEPLSPQMMDPALIGRVYALEQKLARIEALLSKISSVPAAAEAGPPPAAVPPLAAIPSGTMLTPPAAASAAPPPASRVTSAPVSVAPPGPAFDLESLIAGRWLNRIGILAMVIAIALFLKYAFDNAWIGPSGQVAVGVALGAFLLWFSQWLLKHDYRYFSEGIAGLGAAAIYLALWAAPNYYTPPVFSKTFAFVAMILATAAITAIAIGRNSQRIAVLALTGGFLTPILVSSGQDSQVVLFSYLLVLGGGLLWIAYARDWRWIAPLAFIWTQIFFWGWYDRYYSPDRILSTTFFATLFFLLYAALPVIRVRREPQLYNEQVLLVLANSAMYLLALREMLWPDNRWLLTLAALALAAVHLLIARQVPDSTDKRPVARLLYAGLALTFVTLAIPIALDGRWITVAWAVEGAVLIWSGFQASSRLLRSLGLLLFAVVFVRALFADGRTEMLFVNQRFATFLVAIACYAAALYFASQNREQLAPSETVWFGALGVAINILGVWALSGEAYDHFGRREMTLAGDNRLAQQLALSLVWTAYASALMVAGVRRALAALRWQALALFGLVVVKVFLYDLSFLTRFYRILSFMVVGAVLLVVSFLYQRRLAAQRVEGAK